MSANWSDVFVQQHVRPPGASTGLTSTRLTTNAPHASAPDTRTGQPQRGSHSQSHGVLYSPSSPRVHAPLAAAQKALRAPHTSSNTHKHSRSASPTGEHSGAQQSPEEIARDELQRKLTNSARAHVGRTSSSGSSESSAATKRLTSGRPREPQAAPQRATAAPVDSSARSARHVTHQPHKGKVTAARTSSTLLYASMAERWRWAPGAVVSEQALEAPYSSTSTTKRSLCANSPCHTRLSSRKGFGTRTHVSASVSRGAEAWSRRIPSKACSASSAMAPKQRAAAVHL